MFIHNRKSLHSGRKYPRKKVLLLYRLTLEQYFWRKKKRGGNLFNSFAFTLKGKFTELSKYIQP